MMIRRVLTALFLFLFSTALWCDQGFDQIFGDQQAAPSASLSGTIGTRFDYYWNDSADSEVAAEPEGDITLKAGNNLIEASARVSLTPDAVDLKELSLKSFFPFGYLEGGYFLEEWGKGDGDHVLDPLNPIDQTKGFRLDLNEMKSPEILLLLNFYLGTKGNLKLVYKPFYTPLTFATDGRWTVFDITTLPGYASIVPPDTHTLRYSQGAARLTATLGPFDLGLMYYFGFMTEPGYQFTTTFLGGDPLDPANYDTTTDIVYTRAQLFGAEGAWPLGPLTMRIEAGFWLSEDRSGGRPELYNSRLVYLGGLDITIPGTTLFFSAQIKGAYVLKYSGLSDSDVDKMASSDDSPWFNRIIGMVEWPFFRDRMKLRFTGLYETAAHGYLLAPQYFWNILDDLELTVEAKFFGGEDRSNSPWYSWRNNDSASFTIKYSF